MSLPGSYPAFLIASMIASIVASLDERFGANPPSSPTAVTKPCFLRIDFKLWNTSAPQRIASLKDLAPYWINHEFLKSIGASECAPPFTIFIIGTE